MSFLPIRRQQFKTAKFLAWLAEHGAEVGKPTNQYEVVRYKAYGKRPNRAETHIVYAKESGLLTFTGASRMHYERFAGGFPLVMPEDGVQPQPGRAAKADGEELSATGRRRNRLAARDGDKCWFCGDPLGDDATIEHLLPRSKGGGNDMANLVLAHSLCNNEAANLSVAEKVEMRARLRSEVAAL